MTIKNLLEHKGQTVWSIDPDATVLEAVAKMAEKDVGSLVVMDGEILVGIITERHYSRNVILKGQKVPYYAGQGHHGEKRNPCPAGPIG